MGGRDSHGARRPGGGRNNETLVRFNWLRRGRQMSLLPARRASCPLPTASTITIAVRVGGILADRAGSHTLIKWRFVSLCGHRALFVCASERSMPLVCARTSIERFVCLAVRLFVSCPCVCSLRSSLLQRAAGSIRESADDAKAAHRGRLLFYEPRWSRRPDSKGLLGRLSTTHSKTAPTPRRRHLSGGRRAR